MTDKPNKIRVIDPKSPPKVKVTYAPALQELLDDAKSIAALELKRIRHRSELSGEGGLDRKDLEAFTKLYKVTRELVADEKAAEKELATLTMEDLLAKLPEEAREAVKKLLGKDG